MTSATIGALRVDLGLNSAAFEKGLDLMQRRMAGMQKSLQGVADKMSKVGTALTIGVTAPLAAMGGAVLASAKNIAESVPELEKLSKMANVSAQDFQRLAFAAKSVGFESDKLGDVYKDVQDKVGDFLATGGGEMADFFTNIAPKVGVTAEAFRNLSGPQALQLYYNSLEKAGVSQSEMTFYLEALANDATALVPLLQKNGAAFDELGRKAAILSEADIEGFKEYSRASADMDQAFRKLTVAIVSSGLLDAVVSMVTQVTDLATSLSKTNPELLKWGVAIGGAAAALGPLILGLGGMVSGIGALMPLAKGLWTALSALPGVMMAVGGAFRFMLGPIGWATLAIGAAYAAWQNWDKIEPILMRLYSAVKTWVVDKLNAIWEGVKKRIEAVKGYFYDLYDAVVGNSYVPDMVEGIAKEMARLDGVMVRPAMDATSRAAQAFEAMAGRVQGILDRLFPESRAQLNFQADSDALAQMARDGKISAEAYAEAMRRLRQEHATTMQQLERSNPDTIEVLPIDPDEIPQMFDGAWELPGEVKDKVGRPLLHVFQEMARGISEAIANVEGSIRGFVDSIKRGDIAGIIGGIANVIGSIASAISGIKGGFKTPDFPTGPSFPPIVNLSGARALGGPVRAAGSYLVGERGPEIFTPDRAGRIIPNNDLGGGGAPYFDLRGAVMTQDLLRQMNTRAAQAVVQGGQVGSEMALQKLARSRQRSAR